MSAREDQYLKFGDRILLRASEQRENYLAARSQIDGKMFVVGSRVPGSGIAEYPNTSELVFALLPQQQFQAANRFKKFRRQCDLDYRGAKLPSHLEEKKEVLRQRMEAERTQNELRTLQVYR